MKFEFHTNQVNQGVLRKLCEHYILDLGGKSLLKDMSNYLVIFYPSTQSKFDPFFYGKEGVGGNTSPGVSKIYINDVKENFVNVMSPYLRANAVPISHELSHGVLINQGRSEKVPLKHDDYGGNKAGKLLPFYTAEVHDRHIENRFYNINLKIFVPSKLKWIDHPVKVLDIRDLV